MPKYSADPQPVLMTEGVTPRHSERTGFGPLRISRNARVSVDACDCCTRVFRRSAGWSRKALTAPDPRPATMWKAAGWCQYLRVCIVRGSDVKYLSSLSSSEGHRTCQSGRHSVADMIGSMSCFDVMLGCESEVSSRELCDWRRSERGCHSSVTCNLRAHLITTLMWLRFR